MMRLCLKIGLLAVLAAGVAYLGSANAADEPKTKNVKGCMAFQNKVRGDLNKQVKAKDPKWDDIQKQTKEWVQIAAELGTHKPPKGEDKSWKEQTDRYQTNVKAVDAAAEKKDADGVTKSLATIQNSCMGCHSKHRAK
jgi:cytochrome c556